MAINGGENFVTNRTNLDANGHIRFQVRLEFKL